ncbi:hypothetical protein Esti_001527 [Eimeria stiedai]
MSGIEHFPQQQLQHQQQLLLPHQQQQLAVAVAAAAAAAAAGVGAAAAAAFAVTAAAPAAAEAAAAPLAAAAAAAAAKAGYWETAAASAAAKGSAASEAEAAEDAAGRRVLSACSSGKKISLLTAAVEAAVEACSSCSCWAAAGVPVEQRAVYCCLCMQQRQRQDCVFIASPWSSSCRTFAAFANPADAAAAAAEYSSLLPTAYHNNNSSSSSIVETAVNWILASAARLYRLLRFALPLAQMLFLYHMCWTLTGPLPQVLFLLAGFFSCIPLANAIAAVVKVGEERLTIIGDLGVQLSHRKMFGASRRFVPMSQIRDVLISEEVQVYRVVYHVAIVVEEEKKQEILVPFQGFALLLEDCLAAYEALNCLMRVQMRGPSKSQTHKNQKQQRPA